jgi:ribosome maturation factor RimP
MAGALRVEAGNPGRVGERTLAITADWQATVQRTVDGLDYELVDLERAAGGLLRVTIDRIPGRDYPAGDGATVTLDDCERVTRQLQYVLQVAGVDYARLEVSSPGLDRPLKRAADFARFAGERVSLSLKQPLNGRRNYRGRLEAAPPAWRLALEDDQGKPSDQALDFALDEVREARLVPVIDFKGRGGKAPGARPAGQQGDRSQ